METSCRPGGPRARARDLILRAVGTETVVYDRERHRAHCLNDLARLVLDRCDGSTPPPEIARTLEDEGAPLGQADPGAVVEAVLAELGEAGLLERQTDGGSSRTGDPRSRRATLRALGAACLTPLVLSLTAPTPAEAATCVSRDRPCTSSRQCCPDTPCCRPQGNDPPSCRPGAGQCLP